MSTTSLGFGAVPSPKDIRDYKLKVCGSSEIPESYFVVRKAIVKNQGKYPTCVAHSLSEIIEYNYLKEFGEYEQFSTDFIYGLRDASQYESGTEGMYLREGLSVIKNFGDVFYSDLPMNSYASTAHMRVAAKEEELKQKAYPYRVTSYYKITSLSELYYSLMHDGAVAGGMKWFKNNTLEKYVYTFDEKDEYSGHAVIIIGWIKDHFIIQNSWGKTWGKNGLFLIHKDDIFKVFFDLYGVTDDIQSIKKPTKTIKKIAPFINWILDIAEKFLKKKRK